LETRRRRHFSREFKIEVVRQSYESGKSAAQLARELELSINRIYKWRDEIQRHKEGVFPGTGNIATDYKDSELHRLRIENKRLRQERDILKKTLIFFAKNPENDSDLSKNIEKSGQ
jgi:transposase